MAAEAGRINFKALLQDAISDLDVFQQAERIDVKSYGFVIKEGSKDYVAAEIRLKLMEGHAVKEVTLSSWAKLQETETWVTLDDVKAKPETIAILLKLALQG